jgi:uncharacterized protein YneF (UPF0154 family)
MSFATAIVCIVVMALLAGVLGFYLTRKQH